MIKETEIFQAETIQMRGLENESVPPKIEAQWHALYTRGRHEKIVQCELKKRGIETFLPIRKLKRQWSDRIKVVEEVLFQSYVFVQIPLKDRLTALNVYGAVSFVCFRTNVPAVIPTRDIAVLRRFEQEDLLMDPFPYLKEGHRVYIRSGAFKGVQGFVVKKNHQYRLVISLDILMQSVSVEIDAAAIEPM